MPKKKKGNNIEAYQNQLQKDVKYLVDKRGEKVLDDDGNPITANDLDKITPDILDTLDADSSSDSDSQPGPAGGHRKK